jgi:hypothetical protein
MIKRGTQIVNDVADADAYFFDRSGEIGHGLKTDDVIAGLSVRIRPQGGSISFALKERPDVIMEGLTMLFGPIDFGEATFEGGSIHALYSKYEGQEDAENSQGPRNSRANKRRRVQGVGKSGRANKATQDFNSPTPPEEVTSQTAHDHRHGDCIAKHTHLGSPEDV